MKLNIFGSCSGTEPMENRHHTAAALEINGRVYWFDAGETCSYTAHLMGIDLLSVSDIFISHTHMDHIGGLANLLWNIRKLSIVKKELPRFGEVNVHISNLDVFDSVLGVLRGTEGAYRGKYETNGIKIHEGIVLKNEEICVEAVHNNHMPETEKGFYSYSFCIKAEGKKVIYSGDIKDFSELECFLKGSTDALLIETGHHSAPEICKRIKDGGFDIKKVYFMHHGREILGDYDGVLKKCREILPNVVICNDKESFEI